MRFTKKCHRCERRFPTGKRSPDVFCPQCRRQTEGVEFFALVYEDRSGIFRLCATRQEAAEFAAGEPVFVKRVIGHSGAVREVNWTDPDGEIYRRREEAQDRADFEAIQ